MTFADERKCIGCGDTEDLALLEKCSGCGKWFCHDCAHRGQGRRFCSNDCSRAYYYAGDSDDDEDAEPDE
jgi:hypothetical protein